jgi:hypothetical protein
MSTPTASLSCASSLVKRLAGGAAGRDGVAALEHEQAQHAVQARQQRRQGGEEGQPGHAA